MVSVINMCNGTVCGPWVSVINMCNRTVCGPWVSGVAGPFSIKIYNKYVSSSKMAKTTDGQPSVICHASLPCRYLRGPLSFPLEKMRKVSIFEEKKSGPQELNLRCDNQV